MFGANGGQVLLAGAVEAFFWAGTETEARCPELRYGWRCTNLAEATMGMLHSYLPT